MFKPRTSEPSSSIIQALQDVVGEQHVDDLLNATHESVTTHKLIQAREIVQDPIGFMSRCVFIDYLPAEDLLLLTDHETPETRRTFAALHLVTIMKSLDVQVVEPLYPGEFA